MEFFYWLSSSCVSKLSLKDLGFLRIHHEHSNTLKKFSDKFVFCIFASFKQVERVWSWKYWWCHLYDWRPLSLFKKFLLWYSEQHELYLSGELLYNSIEVLNDVSFNSINGLKKLRKKYLGDSLKSREINDPISSSLQLHIVF